MDNNLLSHDEVAVLLLIAVAIGYKVNDVFRQISTYREKARRAKNYASLELASEANTCKGPHSWNIIKLCLPPLAIDDYNCCTHCGFVGGTKYKLNGPGLEVYVNELKNRQLRAARITEYNQALQEGEDRIMNENVKKILNDDFRYKHDLNEQIKFFQHYHRTHKLELKSFWAELREKFKDLDV